MLSSMPVDKARQKVIREYMRKQEQDAIPKGGLPSDKLIIKGSVQRCPIYTLDIHELAFNKTNGRIKAEVVEKESELGRQLDLFVKEEQEIIRQILLSIRSEENNKIKEELRRDGQLRAGIITCDGIVVNGNRRKAILKELYDETHDNKFKYLDVQVLPSDITKAELWLIEAGIQMSAPQQLDYSPINHLLKLREGINAGLNMDDMAARIYGVTRDKIEDDLERLNLIDEYLSEFLQKEGRYYLVKNSNEHFIDLQNISSWAKRPRGRVRADWDWEESDINELKLVAFYYIRMRYSHWRIRDLRDIFATKASWVRAKKVFDIDTNLTKPVSVSSTSVEVAPDDNDDEDGQESTDLPVSSFEEKDLQEESHWRKQSEAGLKTIYEEAKEQEQVVKDAERPLALAKRALLNLQAIPRESEKLTEPDMDSVLSQIIERTNALRKLIGKSNKKKHK